MIKNANELNFRPLKIDLTGPDGNAFALLRIARKLAKKFEMDNSVDICDDMMSGDYENLVEVFDKHFGDVVILYR